MTRQPKQSAPKVPDIQPDYSQFIVEEREYDVITPLFGGGVEPGSADPITVVRASEIRGQLRFWWRATRGGQFGNDLESLRAAEEALWGGAAQFDGNGKVLVGPSLVQVEVEVTNRGWPLVPVHSDSTKKTLDAQGKLVSPDDPTTARRLNGCSQYEMWNKQENRSELRPLYAGSPESIDGYIAFPLRPEPGTTPGVLLEGVAFRLHVRYPSSWPDTVKLNTRLTMTPFVTRSPDEEIAAAFWAWETFGGLGARTRRGCGAVSLRSWKRHGLSQNLDRPETPKHLDQWLKQHLADSKLLTGALAIANVPHIHAATEFKRGSADTSGKKVWRALGKKLKDFRQRRNPGFKGSKFGRSKWPEPDAVRDFSGQYFEDMNDSSHHHRAPVHGKVIKAFPRAAFGLPISFEFQRDQTNTRRLKQVDPVGKNTLEGDQPDQQRLASPLILRPMLCRNGQYVGLAIILDGVNLPPMKLTTHLGLHPGMIAQMNSTDAGLVRSKGISELPTSTGSVNPRDILRAFLKSL